MTLTSHDLPALPPCILDMMRFAHLDLPYRCFNQLPDGVRRAYRP